MRHVLLNPNEIYITYLASKGIIMCNEITIYYGGSGTNKATCYVYDGWYCIEGSTNINRTDDVLENGTNVELVSDYDFMTADQPVESVEDLIEEIEGNY
jgi:hypothetical protein